MRRSWIALVVVLAGCSSGAPSEPPAARPALTGAQAHAGAPPTSGALTQIPDTEATRIRLGYVAVDALAQADLPVSARDVKRRVLGAGAAALPDSGVTSAVQVGADATVLRGDVAGLDGVPSGEDGVVIGADAQAAGGPGARDERDHARGAERGAVVPRRHAGADDPRPRDDGRRRGARASGSPRAATSPRASSCGSAARRSYIRHIHAMEKRLEARFGDLNAVIGEREIGEREIVAGVVAADGSAAAPGSAAARGRPRAARAGLALSAFTEPITTTRRR